MHIPAPIPGNKDLERAKPAERGKAELNVFVSLTYLVSHSNLTVEDVLGVFFFLICIFISDVICWGEANELFLLN